MLVWFIKPLLRAAITTPSTASRLHTLILPLAALFIALPASANSNWGGYISLGTADARDNSFYDLDGSNPGLLTEVVLNGRHSLDDRLQLSGQVMYRHKGKTQEEEVRLDYAFLDYTLASSNNSEYHSFLGRFKNSIGLQGSTLDVPFSRTASVLPQSIYDDISRDLYVAADGIAFKSTHLLADGELEFMATLGQLDMSKQLTANLIGDYEDNLDNKDFYNLGIDYSFAGQWLVGFDYVYVDIEHSASAASTYQSGNIELERNYLFLRYSAESWELNLEYLSQDATINNLLSKNLVGLSEFIASNSFLPPAPALPTSNDTTSDSYYIQLRYFLNEQLTLMLGYDVIYANRDDKNGREHQQQYEQLSQLSDFVAELPVIGQDFGIKPSPAYSQYQKTATLGLSWQPNQDWVLMFEYHRIKGSAVMPARINKQLDTERHQHSSLLIFQASYRF